MTETRAEKAQRLVDEGRVNIYHRVCRYAEARVDTENGRYSTITFSSGHFFCTCKWGAMHSYTADLCAHALAVKLAVKADDEAERAHTETLLNALDETWGI